VLTARFFTFISCSNARKKGAISAFSFLQIAEKEGQKPTGALVLVGRLERNLLLIF
jgi:hypothetical protein